MSKITSEKIVGEHTVDGRCVQVQQITWSGTDGCSYDLIEPRTGRVLTLEESFDYYPTDQEIREVLRGHQQGRDEIGLAITQTIQLVGEFGFHVEVEAAITSGSPSLRLIGSSRETHDRIHAAIHNSGEARPNGHVTVSMRRRGTTIHFPTQLPTSPAALDVATAIAVLAAAEAVPPESHADMVLIGELGLDGRIRAVPGALAAVLTAANHGCRTVVVPRANLADAQPVAERLPYMQVISPDTLSDLLSILRAGPNARTT